MPVPGNLDELASAFAAFFAGKGGKPAAAAVRAVADGSLLRALEADAASDPELVAFLRRVQEIPDRKVAAWTAWNLLRDRRPVPPPPRRSRPLFLKVLLALVLFLLLLLGGTWLALRMGWAFAPSRAETRSFGAATAVGGIRSDLERQIATRRRIESLLTRAPENARLVWRVLSDSGDGLLVATMLQAADSASGASVTGNVFAWAHEPGWDSCAKAVESDLPAIRWAASRAGLSPRLVALPAICEQLRRTESFRELYKRFFTRFVPAGNLSMGVTGVKLETLRSMVSLFPPEERRAIDLLSDDSLETRLKSPDRRWAYLYGALCLYAIRQRWAQAGIDLSRRPEILMTVYNLGSNRCPPRPDPQAGGALFRLGAREYTFGSFAWEFYWSGVLYPELPF